MTQRNKADRVSSVKKYLEADVAKVILTNVSHATLAGRDGRSRGWVQGGTKVPMRLKRQQGGGGGGGGCVGGGCGGDMFWAGIVGDVLIGRSEHLMLVKVLGTSSF